MDLLVSLRSCDVGCFWGVGNSLSGAGATGTEQSTGFNSSTPGILPELKKSLLAVNILR